MRTLVNTSDMSDRDFRNYKKKCMRQKEIRRNIFLIVLAIVLVLVSVVLFHAFISDANTSTEGMVFKYYTSVEVAPGESLWSIAENYLDDHYDGHEQYISEVVSINHLQDEGITSGQYLIVPYYSEEFVK